MRPSRRTVLKGVAASAIAAQAAPGATQETPSLVIFDSRVAASRVFAQKHLCPKIDVAHEDASFWRGLRGATPGGTVVGLTCWTDLVAVRGVLEAQGKRLKSETPHGGLFRWDMA